MQLPFVHLNLRVNPFGQPTAAERGELAIVDRERMREWLRRLDHERFALQFLAEPGRGKSTHLLAIHQERPNIPYVNIPDVGPQPPIPPGDRILLDEAERLPFWRRWWIWRRRRAVVLGVHRDLTKELARAGFRVETVEIRRLDPARLVEIAARRIEWARRDAGAVPQIPIKTAERLVEQYGDDLRAIEDHLYETFQALEGPTDVEV